MCYRADTGCVFMSAHNIGTWQVFFYIFHINVPIPCFKGISVGPKCTIPIHRSGKMNLNISSNEHDCNRQMASCRHRSTYDYSWNLWDCPRREEESGLSRHMGTLSWSRHLECIGLCTGAGGLIFLNLILGITNQISQTCKETWPKLHGIGQTHRKHCLI